MSWVKLAPVGRAGGDQRVTAGVHLAKSGVASICIGFSKALLATFGEAVRCDVAAGAGDDAGRLQITFGKNGAFKISALGNGGGLIRTPSVEGVPAAAKRNLICAVSDRAADSVVVTLPFSAWEALPAKPGKAAAPPSPPAGGKIDVVAYLRGKGANVERLAGDRYTANGTTVTLGALLRMANARRQEAELAPLTLEQIR